MNLDIYIEKPSTKIWFEQITNELNYFLNTVFHNDFSNIYKKFSTLKSLQNHIVVIDIDSSYYNELLQQLKLYYPNIKLLAVGKPMKIEDIMILFKKGFYSFVEISQTSIEVYNTLKQIKSGNLFLHNDKMDELLRTFVLGFDINSDSIISSANIYSHKNLDLTIKQKEVFDYLLKGYTYKEIATFLGITTYTVNQRTKVIYKKLNVKSRNELSYLFST